MIYKELKRIIFNVPAFTIIMTALLFSILFSYVIIYRYSGENGNIDEYYKEYMEKLEGELTEEKEVFIQEEKKFINETIENEGKMLSMYNNNEMDSEKYQQYLNDNYYAVVREASIEKVNEQYQSLLQLKENGTAGYFLYDTYWNLYFDMKMVTFIQMILVMALVISYLSRDYISGMWRMTQTYFNGRSRLFHIRLGAVILSCVGISLLFSSVYYAFFQAMFCMPDMNAPIQSLDMFRNFPLSISISGFLVLISVFRILALCLLGIFTFAVTSIVQNIMISFGICGFIILIPMLFSATSEIFLKFSFYEVVLGTGIMSRSMTVNHLIRMPAGFILFSFIIYGIALLKQSDLITLYDRN